VWLERTRNAASAKAEHARVAALKAGDNVEIDDADVAMVPRLTAIRTFTFQNSGFTDLVQVVHEKLALYNKIKE